MVTEKEVRARIIVEEDDLRIPYSREFIAWLAQSEKVAKSLGIDVDELLEVAYRRGDIEEWLNDMVRSELESMEGK